MCKETHNWNTLNYFGRVDTTRELKGGHFSEAKSHR